MKKIRRELKIYLAIGVASNVISFITYSLLSIISFGITIAAASGMVAGVINTYTLGRIYIKEKKIKHSNTRLIQFGIYYGIMIAITSHSIELISDLNIAHHYVVWFFCNAIAACCNFLCLSFIALRN